MINIYIQHQINTFLMQLLYIRRMKTQHVNKACIVSINGPTASGKQCVAAYMSDIIKKRIQLGHLEIVPVEVVTTHTLTTRYYNELSENMFVAIFLVTCKFSEKSDISLSMTSLISPSKLQKQFNITMARLKAFGYNFNLALENNHLQGLSDSQILNVLSNQLYTKRCTSEIYRIANDIDFICFMDMYSHVSPDHFPILNIFLQFRPHVNTAFRSHASQKIEVPTNPDNFVLKTLSLNTLKIQLDKP